MNKAIRNPRPKPVQSLDMLRTYLYEEHPELAHSFKAAPARANATKFIGFRTRAGIHFARTSA